MQRAQQWKFSKHLLSLTSGLKTSSGKLEKKEFAFFMVEEEGLKGFGELSVSPSLSTGTLDDNIAQICSYLGKGPFIGDLENLESHTGALTNPAKAAISTALLDLTGKKTGSSAETLLKVPQATLKKTCYTIGQSEDIRSLPSEIKKYSAIKVKTNLSLADAERINSLAKGINGAIWLDAEGASVSVPQYQEFIAMLDKKFIKLIEDPFPGIPDERWKALSGGIPVFADRPVSSTEDIRLYAKFINGVVVKPLKLGGVFSAKEALLAAQLLGLKTMIGCYVETSVSLSAWFSLEGMADLLDLDGNTRLSNEPFLGIRQTADGLKRHEGNGIGVQPVSNDILWHKLSDFYN